jgi:diacylglycerol O-acyltransferase / wax synthase
MEWLTGLDLTFLNAESLNVPLYPWSVAEMDRSTLPGGYRLAPGAKLG